MIPWFIVHLVGVVAGLVGRDVYVTATGNSWRWGADRIHFMRHVPGVPRPQRLAPYRGGRLTEGDVVTCGIDITEHGATSETIVWSS